MSCSRVQYDSTPSPTLGRPACHPLSDPPSRFLWLEAVEGYHLVTACSAFCVMEGRHPPRADCDKKGSHIQLNLMPKKDPRYSHSSRLQKVSTSPARCHHRMRPSRQDLIPPHPALREGRGEVLGRLSHDVQRLSQDMRVWRVHRDRSRTAEVGREPIQYGWG